jgi:hypothetical protein
MKTVKKMQMGGTTMMSDSTMMKKGGAVAKMKKAKLPTEVRNKMGYKKYGGATSPKMKMGGAMKGKKC